MKRNFIGGFFGLENSKTENYYHKNAYALSNGRTCFNVILQNAKPLKVYVPFYCCNSLLEPLIENRIEYIFYSINDKLEPEYLPEVSKEELLVYINYFGLKNDIAKKLADRYKMNIVIDNTHSYFSYGYRSAWSFNSSRKFFGVPDGAFLYAAFPLYSST